MTSAIRERIASWAAWGAVSAVVWFLHMAPLVDAFRVRAETTALLGRMPEVHSTAAVAQELKAEELRLAAAVDGFLAGGADPEGARQFMTSALDRVDAQLVHLELVESGQPTETASATLHFTVTPERFEEALENLLAGPLLVVIRQLAAHRDERTASSDEPLQVKLELQILLGHRTQKTQ